MNSYKDGVEKNIVVDDKPFTEAESYFINATFYLKNHIWKELRVSKITKSKSDELGTTRAEVVAGKVKVVAKEYHPSSNKSHKGYIMSSGKKVTHVLRYVP